MSIETAEESVDDRAATAGCRRWPLLPLGDLCEFVLDGSHGSPTRQTDGVPLLSAKNVYASRLHFDEFDRVADSEFAAFRRRLPIRCGDVLLTIVGSIGRAAVVETDRLFMLLRSVAVLRPRANRLFPPFLMRALESPDFQAALIGRTKQGSQPGVYLGDVKALSIPLPPLAEQQRIAGLLTEQLGAVERARAAAAQRLAAAESLPAAILREVFEGPQASGWETRTLGELCNGTGQYGTSAKSNGMERGLPVLGMPHIHEGRIRWTRVSYSDLPPDELDKYRLAKGDLLFNRTNSAELVGKTAVFDGARDAVFASYLIRFRVREDIADPRFISAYINSRQGRAFIERHMTRAVGQVNISASTMIAMSIPCPPAFRQREIMDHEYSPRLAAAERVIARCRDELAAIEALPAAILRDAFGQQSS